MADKRLIVVFGATGMQGGSVVRSLLKDGHYRVRAVTRDPTSSKAKALSEKGVEVVKADQANADQTSAALNGAYGVFLVTNFWDEGTSIKEAEYASRIVKEAKDAGVTHMVWSTLPNSDEVSEGRYEIPHFAGKAKVDPIVASAGFKYYTFALAAHYFQNFEWFQFSEDKPDGTMSFNLRLGAFDEGSLLTGFDVTETGPAVVGAFNKPEEWGSGQQITYGATAAPMKEYLETFTKVTGRPAVLNDWPAERTMFKEEFVQMLSYFNDYGLYKGSELNSAEKAAGEPLSTWEQYLQKSGFGQKKPLEY